MDQDPQHLATALLERVNEGDALLVLESMKMEIEVTASEAGTIRKILQVEGSQVAAGQRLLVMELT